MRYFENVSGQSLWKGFFVIALLFSLSSTASAQGGFWDKLAGVRFVSKQDPVSGYYYYYPEFDNYLKMKEGQIVEIEGFYLPYDFGPGSVILSKYPLASCFFCGANGPESVIQVNFDNPMDFHTDEIVRVQGVLMTDTWCTPASNMKAVGVISPLSQ
ncbi:MAG: hypothetical protein AAGC88_04920, partial [Bacteroidota bacterium]